MVMLPGQLTKDPGGAQLTPSGSLRRTGTILSKASALSQFSNYGECVYCPHPLREHYMSLLQNLMIMLKLVLAKPIMVRL